MVTITRRLASICTVLVSGLFTSVAANNDSAVYVGPGVPYGVAPTGDYTGQWRPQVHFSPPYGFMNDPNGLHRSANGTWHLYYQINPTGLVSDFQHWGHATSDDLYHWVNQPIALFPTDNETYVWTGAAVVDTNNTSGFFPNQTDGVIAMYSLWNSTLEVQGISYSRDGGYTFTPYHGNPVLVRPVSFGDIGLGWYEDHWYMVTTFDDFKIGIFTSPNMIDWTPTSNVSYVGLIGSNYQCPNLKQIPLKNSTESMWVLWMSISPGAPNGGAVQQFVPGNFNGTHFTPLDGVARLNDFAEDFYAAQFWSNLPVEETYSIGWASNWDYCQQVPTASEGWRSAMSLPRKNHMNEIKPHQWQLVSEPADLTPVMGDSLWSGSLLNQTDEIDFSNSSGAVVLEFNITTPANLSSTGLSPWLNFTFCSADSSESLVGRYDWGLSTISLDRSKTYAFDYPYYVDKWSLANFETLQNIQVVFDRSMIEVFVNDGDISGTMVVYANNPLTKVQIGTSELPAGLQIDASVNALNSIWR